MAPASLGGIFITPALQWSLVQCSGKVDTLLDLRQPGDMILRRIVRCHHRRAGYPC